MVSLSPLLSMSLNELATAKNNKNKIKKCSSPLMDCWSCKVWAKPPQRAERPQVVDYIKCLCVCDLNTSSYSTWKSFAESARLIDYWQVFCWSKTKLSRSGSSVTERHVPAGRLNQADRAAVEFSSVNDRVIRLVGRVLRSALSG